MDAVKKHVEKPWSRVYDFIGAGLTSVYQPPDVIINKPLKDEIKRGYESYRNSIATDFVPGEKIKISRERLTDFILDAYEAINEENMNNCYIRRGFDQCGLNPYVTDDNIFREHLKELTLTSAYRALIDKTKPVEC